MPKDIEFTEDGGVIVTYSGAVTGAEVAEAAKAALLNPEHQVCGTTWPTGLQPPATTRRRGMLGLSRTSATGSPPPTHVSELPW